MKILWFCNVVLPNAAKAFNLDRGSGGGWVEGILDTLLRSSKEYQIHIVFTNRNMDSPKKASIENVTYHVIPKKEISPSKYDLDTELHLKKIIDTVKPDIIHIFGTEYPHTLAMMNVCPHDKTVISIQGLVSIISRHYNANLPNLIQEKFNVKYLLMRIITLKQQREFRIRGNFEIKAIQKSKHIIGRTTWDYACTKKINDKVNYYFCNETLRGEFYNHKWDINSCNKYSIFFSQAGYPVKGLHVMLEAMIEIVKRYPKAHLYIAGSDITDTNSITDKLGISYGRYIKKVIMKNNLEKNITFTGNLDEREMCSQYLKANVFVSASSIENSPNSLGEAMILGVPCVSSCVGGVQDFIVHKEEGYVYPSDEPYMLSHYICEIFSDDKKAMEFSKKARKRALSIYDRHGNGEDLINIYKTILSTHK